MGALALASALACSVAPARGRPRVCGGLSRPLQRQEGGDPSQLLTRTPEPAPGAWARWWRSRRRPHTARQTIWLNGRPVELFREALLPGWQYPFTDSELEAALRELPAAWTARLRSVRLTFHPEWEAYARTDRSRVEFSYIVDAGLEAPGEVLDDTPEEVEFGARLEEWGEARRLVWPDRDRLRLYILRHILIHELGHHVAPPGMSWEDEEDWAEAFAYRYYTPPGPNHVAEAP
jgi:hypothetical protein